MAAKVALLDGATERQSLPATSGRPLKIEPQPKVPARTLRLVSTVADAVRLTDQQKNAAAAIGISEGRLSAKLKDGSLTVAQLDRLGDVFGQRLGEECVRTFGTETAEQRFRRLILEAREKFAEIEAAYGARR